MQTTQRTHAQLESPLIDAALTAYTASREAGESHDIAQIRARAAAGQLGLASMAAITQAANAAAIRYARAQAQH